MNPTEALKWTHEGQIALTNVQAQFTRTNSLTGWDCMNLCRGAESLVKAVEVARTGAVSHTHSLVALSQKAGLWGTLPPEHREAMVMLERYGAFANYPDDPGHHTLTNSTGPQEAAHLLARVSSLFDFVGKQVLTGSACP